MIKKVLLAIMIALPRCAMAQTKIGVINADAVFQVMPEAANIQTQVQNISKQYEDAFKKLNEEGQRLVAEFQAMEKDPTVANGIKEDKMKEIQACEIRIQEFRKTAEQDIQKQIKQLQAPIEEKLMKTITEVGKENGFTAILPLGLALYTGSDVIDITPMVKAKLGIK